MNVWMQSARAVWLAVRFTVTSYITYVADPKQQRATISIAVCEGSAIQPARRFHRLQDMRGHILFPYSLSVLIVSWGTEMRDQIW